MLTYHARYLLKYLGVSVMRTVPYSQRLRKRSETGRKRGRMFTTRAKEWACSWNSSFNFSVNLRIFQNKTLGKTNSSDASELNRTKTSKNPPLARVLKMPSSQCMKGSELVCRKAEVPRCKVTPRSPARTTGRDHTAICWGGWHGRRSQF